MCSCQGLKLTLVQQKIESDLEKNLAKIKNFIEKSQGELVVFPELSLTGYQRFLEREKIEKALEELKEFVKRFSKKILLGAPFFKNDQVYNAVYLVSSQKAEVVAEKITLFPGIDDLFGFSSGTLRKELTLKGFKIGLIICFELRSPEIARSLIREGINLLVVLAQWPKVRISHWETLLQARAVENQVYVAGVNALGDLKGLELGGNSSFFSPQGEKLAFAETENLIEVQVVEKKEVEGIPLKTPYLELSKVKSLKEVKDITDLRRRKGQIMVFTNGCFDLLHAGHVAYLEKARSLGDFLIVGLNSDNSIKKIKGPSRPILSQEMRAKTLSALSCVDYIIIFEEETPEKLIQELKPDLLVKGADWEEEQIVGASLVKTYGGKVIRIPFTFEISTTKIIEKLKNF